MITRTIARDEPMPEDQKALQVQIFSNAFMMQQVNHNNNGSGTIILDIDQAIALQELLNEVIITTPRFKE